MREFRQALQVKEEANRSVDELANEVLETVIPQNKLLARVRSNSELLQTGGVLKPLQRRSSDPAVLDELHESDEWSRIRSVEAERPISTR